MLNYMENIFWKFFRRIWKAVLRLPISSVLFSLWKKEEKVVQLIFPTHPSSYRLTLYVIGFIDGIHKKEVETPSAFELFLVRIIGVLADFTPANIALTTNQVFSNPFTPMHTTHNSYITESEFNCLDNKFYYDPNID
jgi:hypothetical protein